MNNGKAMQCIINNELNDFPFHSRTAHVKGVRIHYIDVGDKNKPTIILLHGIPTWSYTFRKVIPQLQTAGYRVVAPDLPGLGFSSRIQKNRYSLREMAKIIGAFISNLKLGSYFIYGEDWGAVLAMVHWSQFYSAICGVAVSNGFLPTLNGDRHLPFSLWKLFVNYSPILPVSTIIDFGTFHSLTRFEKAAFDLPFTHLTSKDALRRLPNILPTKPEDNEADFAKDTWKRIDQLDTPFIILFSTNDAVTKLGFELLEKRISGARNEYHKMVRARHFITEDAPYELANELINFMNRNSK